MSNISNCIEILKKEKKIKVGSYIGYWSVIDDLHGYVLLEHNTWGDETCSLVAKASDFQWKTFRHHLTDIPFRIPYFENDQVFETYDDIETCLKDEGIL